MEALSKMVNAIVEQGLLTGFSVGIRVFFELVVSHSLFANDTLIFVKLPLSKSCMCALFSYVLKLFRG
jgi:hypothetical protein